MPQPKPFNPMREALSRRFMIHICKDGTISVRDTATKEPVFNGIALPVFSVDTIEQAEQIQIRFCRRQYYDHPQMPGRTWFRLSVLEDGTDPALRGDGTLQGEDLEGVARMFARFFAIMTKQEG